MTTQAINPICVKLEPDVKSRLKNLSKTKDRTIHWLMKEAISQYLDAEERAEKIKQETLARWQEAEQNKTVSHKSMVAWLDTWGTDNETGRPECES